MAIIPLQKLIIPYTIKNRSEKFQSGLSISSINLAQSPELNQRSATMVPLRIQ